MKSESRKAKLEKSYEKLRRRGKRYFVKGILFLTSCLTIGQIAHYYEFPFAWVISEGISVAGWVAMWKPMEIYLYDLPELKRRINREQI
jgi:hypothetical protein